MENPANIRNVCPTHAPKPNPKFASMPTNYFIGKYCKLGFPVPEGCGPTHEHMWIKVTGPGKEKELRGNLDNTPFYLDDICLGEKVEFDRNEIEDVLASETS